VDSAGRAPGHSPQDSERDRRLGLGLLYAEHHQALLAARRLQRAGRGDPGDPPEEAARAFLDFWRREAESHLRKEEEILIPLLSRRDPGLGERPVLRMLAQHARIRGMVISLQDEDIEGHVRAKTLWELGEALETHILLEEREVFPHVGRMLPEGDLIRAHTRMLALTDQAPHILAESLCFGPLPGPGDSEGGGQD
jgi:iron-sulfur cluster repair protein YtfE (RIC family)